MRGPRDVTLGDASGRSVVVTLWNDNAHSRLLDGAEGQLLQVGRQTRVWLAAKHIWLLWQPQYCQQGPAELPKP